VPSSQKANPGLNGRSLDWPRGKTLGGSSSINGLLYVRGQSHDYDQWAQFGNRGWSWNDVLPLFKKSESHQDGEVGSMEVTAELRCSSAKAFLTPIHGRRKNPGSPW